MTEIHHLDTAPSGDDAVMTDVPLTTHKPQRRSSRPRTRTRTRNRTRTRRRRSKRLPIIESSSEDDRCTGDLITRKQKKLSPLRNPGFDRVNLNEFHDVSPSDTIIIPNDIMNGIAIPQVLIGAETNKPQVFIEEETDKPQVFIEERVVPIISTWVEREKEVSTAYQNKLVRGITKYFRKKNKTFLDFIDEIVGFLSKDFSYALRKSLERDVKLFEHLSFSSEDRLIYMAYRDLIEPIIESMTHDTGDHDTMTRSIDSYKILLVNQSKSKKSLSDDQRVLDRRERDLVNLKMKEGTPPLSSADAAALSNQIDVLSETVDTLREKKREAQRYNEHIRGLTKRKRESLSQSMFGDLRGASFFEEGGDFTSQHVSAFMGNCMRKRFLKLGRSVHERYEDRTCPAYKTLRTVCRTFDDVCEPIGVLGGEAPRNIVPDNFDEIVNDLIIGLIGTESSPGLRHNVYKIPDRLMRSLSPSLKSNMTSSLDTFRGLTNAPTITYENIMRDTAVRIHFTELVSVKIAQKEFDLSARQEGGKYHAHRNRENYERRIGELLLWLQKLRFDKRTETFHAAALDYTTPGKQLRVKNTMCNYHVDYVMSARTRRKRRY